VRERNSDGGERHVRQAVSERVQKRRDRQRLQKIRGRLFKLDQPRRPEERHDEQTNAQVHARHKPRERKVVVDGLVDDIELDVEKIPRRKVKNGFRRRKLFLELGQRGSSVFLTRVR
jgi:hypothetical protein